ncbi:hypothetical protein [Undibacterium flavidum]|uniref:DUF2909 family protein n=1 Tax=Undibacterium flavidum TaxID=2762297 RepID=A0ABR6Y8N8_9BURK|nr:hypothetical protein [Undibacterium flavidum]MBC3872529.1 hypothetical protein [Undibacterium flavidum]
MKHFLLLLIGGLALYGIWQLTTPLLRKNATQAISRHGLRIVAFILILVILLITAYYTPALHLL